MPSQFLVSWGPARRRQRQETVAMSVEPIKVTARQTETCAVDDVEEVYDHVVYFRRQVNHGQLRLPRFVSRSHSLDDLERVLWAD